MRPSISSMGSAVLAMLLQSGKKTAGPGAGKLVAHSHLLRWLMSLGGVGLFLVAFIDSSLLPIPLPGSADLLLLLLASHRGASVASATILALSTFAGSMTGGYLSWSAGRKGGDATLSKYMSPKVLKRVTGWVEKHGAWSVGIAALLPPPAPLMPLVVVAGALKVPRGMFLLSYGIARGLRYAFLGWLSVAYGRRIVRLWEQKLGEWSSVILWTYVAIVTAGILWSLYKWRQARNSGLTGPEPAGETA